MIGNAVLLRRRRVREVAVSSSLHRRARAPPESIQFVTFVLLHHRARIPQSWNRCCDTNANKAFGWKGFRPVTATHFGRKALTSVQDRQCISRASLIRRPEYYGRLAHKQPANLPRCALCRALA